jgi:hypothetical protein
MKLIILKLFEKHKFCFEIYFLSIEKSDYFAALNFVKPNA